MYERSSLLLAASSLIIGKIKNGERLLPVLGLANRLMLVDVLEALFDIAEA